MRWLAITISDLYNSKSATLIDQINQNLLGAGQTDRVTVIIADVTLEVRRKVAVQYSIDIDPTKIPGGLKTLAVDMIYCRLKIAAEMTLSEDERIALRKKLGHRAPEIPLKVRIQDGAAALARAGSRRRTSGGLARHPRSSGDASRRWRGNRGMLGPGHQQRQPPQPDRLLAPGCADLAGHPHGGKSLCQGRL